MENDKYKKQVAHNFKFYMFENKMKYQELSRKIGVDASILSRLAHAKRMPSLSIFKKIAKGLGISVSDLDPELGDVPESKGSVEFSVDKQMLNDAYDDLSAPAKLELQRLLREVQLKDKLKDSQTG